MIVTTTQGPVRGTTANGVNRFLGIPYAAAPFGADRFRMPRPHDPWTEPRDATAYGPTAPQTPYQAEVAKILPTVVVPGEEILNLNLWAPTEGTGHPVMVWVHGGGLMKGANCLETYDGTAFARDGVVLVAINYRLGAEGFTLLDDAPANLGLADQAEALRWVRDNITAFGGDPSRVTVFGQSAGGAAVAALLAHPEAPSLMSGAIVQSGPLAAVPSKGVRKATARLAKDLGIPTTREAFAAVSPEDLLAAQTRVFEKGSILAGGPSLGICVDEATVPVDPADALAAGAGSSVRLMLGYTTEEYRLWFVPSGAIDKLNGLHLFGARLKLKASRRAVGLYRRNRPGAKTGEILGMLATDAMLRLPKNRLADARGGKTWMYEFAWRSPVDDLGAAHALELGFIFDTLATEESKAFAGPEAPQELADELHAA
jgi:para-nitrobenzyl esterase